MTRKGDGCSCVRLLDGTAGRPLYLSGSFRHRRGSAVPGSTILLALNDIEPGSVVAGQLERICEHLAEEGHDVVRAGTDEDALALVQSRADLTAALVSWDFKDADGVLERPAEAVLKALLGRFTRLPAFLVTTAASVDDLPLWVSEAVCGYVWLLEDTRASSPAGSVAPRAAIRRSCCPRSSGSFAASTTPTSIPGTPRRT